MDNVRVKVEERLRAAFAEVMQKAGGLIDEALDEHFADMKAIFLRDRALTVSLALAVDMNEAGQIEVAITTGYVKEKVKQKTTARVTPGQTEIPPEAYRTVDPGGPATGDQERRPIADESRMIGAGAPQLAAGEPLHMGAGEDVDEARSCATCRNNDGDGGGCHVGGVECGPALKFYAPPEHAEPEAKTCHNCGSREGEHGCGLDPDACDEPCGSWSPMAEVDHHPFAAGRGARHQDVESRLSCVKEMDAEQLRAVIALPGCQKSVVQAAERRLRKLEKEAAARSCLNCGNNNPDEDVCSQACNGLSAWVAA